MLVSLNTTIERTNNRRVKNNWKQLFFLKNENNEELKMKNYMFLILIKKAHLKMSFFVNIEVD